MSFYENFSEACVENKKKTKCIYKLKNATKKLSLQNLSLIKSFSNNKIM